MMSEPSTGVRLRERRSAPRIPLEIPILLASERGWTVARTQDLSRTGISVVGTHVREVAEGGVTHLYFELPKLVSVETEGCLVRWVGWACAFQFDPRLYDADIALRSWLHARSLRLAASRQDPEQWRRAKE